MIKYGGGRWPISKRRASGGARHSWRITALATEGDDQIKKVADDVIYLPETLECIYPILASVPLQLFAYHIAVARGCDVDKPRNLAKSVTVE